MKQDIQRMYNMAFAMAEMMMTEVDRLDLQRTKLSGSTIFYNLHVWYTDGTHYTLRENCTIVGQ